MFPTSFARSANYQEIKRTAHIYRTCISLFILIAFIIALWMYRGVKVSLMSSMEKLGTVDELSTSNIDNLCISSCSFMIIADLDTRSRTGILEGPSHYSIERRGKLQTNSDGTYAIEWLHETPIYSSFNAGGRGMELSELIKFNGELLSFDDRTGIVYIHEEGGKISPKYIISEGDGLTEKGMKVEWATVKDDMLYIGGFGKEFVATDGTILNEHNMWVATIDKMGTVRRYNWRFVYDRIRSHLGVEFPGYCIHEAINWSKHHNRWYFLPRRISKEAYNELDDEKKGSNYLISCSPEFDDFTSIQIGEVKPTRGYSTFKFIPGSNDMKIFAIKTEENATEDTQNSYATVFTLDGVILMEDVEIPGGYKFEGLEFL